MSNEQVSKITEVLEGLVEKMDNLEKAFEGAFRPVPGAKDQPEEPTTTPDLGESEAEKGLLESDTEKAIPGADKVIGALKTGAKAIKDVGMKAKPALESAGVKTKEFATQIKGKASSAVNAAKEKGSSVLADIHGKGKAIADATKVKVKAGVDAAKPFAEMAADKAKDVAFIHAPKAAAKVKEFAGKHKTALIAGGAAAGGAAAGYAAGSRTKKMADLIEEKGLSEEDLTKLYEGFIELEEEMEKGMAGCEDGNITDTPGNVEQSAPEEGGDPATVMPDVETHDAKEVVKNEQEEAKEEAVEKVADVKEEEALTKVTNELETLRKRFDAVTELLNKPMPRKRIIEKNADSTHNADSEFQNQRAQVLEWVKSGKPLTAEQEKVRADVLAKSMDAKFGKAL